MSEQHKTNYIQIRKAQGEITDHHKKAIGGILSFRGYRQEIN